MRRRTEMAKRETAELLTPAHNYAVVQLPGRQFPGVVFQGDSLSILVSDIAELSDLLEAREYGELSDCIAEIETRLSGVLDGYEAVCKQNGLSLPYVRDEK